MSAASRAGRSRFAQLAYSSFDAGRDGGGGWQVKETCGGLGGAEAEELTSRLSTRIDAGVALDRFPTPEQVTALPRRLVYAPVPGSGSAYWHTAPAGVDGSGRPGNVFAHVLLDREPASTSIDLRPIELWRSPMWLTPFNPDQVIAAVLPQVDEPPAGSALDRVRVLEFLLDPAFWRVGVLTGLLDAVSAALAGGRPVVLGTQDVDRSAAWIAGVSHLMSAGTSRTLYFSTLERADGLRTVIASGAHLVCVPRGDLPLLAEADDLVVLDEDETLGMGELGGEPHTTEHGSTITATAWSVLAQVILQDSQTAHEALAQMDHIAGAVGDVALAPPWPLAMAVLQRPVEFADALDEAALVVSASYPAGLDDRPDLAELAQRGVTRTLGTTTGQAWSRAATAAGGSPSATGSLVLSVYLERAMHDSAWLVRPGGVPLPDLAPDQALLTGRHDLEPLVAALEERARQALGNPEELACETVRLFDLLVRLGAWSDGDLTSAGLRDRFETLLQILVVPPVLDRVLADSLVRAVGPVSAALREHFVVPLVAIDVDNLRDLGIPLGERVPPSTIDWLIGGPVIADVPFAGAERAAASMSILDRESLAQDCMAADRRREPATAPVLAVVVALQEMTAGWAIAVNLDQLLVDAQIDVDDMSQLVRAYGGLVPEAALARIVTASAWSSGLDALCDAISPDERRLGGAATAPDGETTLQRLVRMRRAAHGGWRLRSAAIVRHRAAGLCREVAWAAAVLPGTELSGDVVARAQAAWTICVLAGEIPDVANRSVGHAGWGSVLDRVLVDADAVAAAEAIDLFAEHALVVAAAVAAAPGAPMATLVDREVSNLVRIRACIDGVVSPLLDHVARRFLAADLVDLGGLATDAANAVAAGKLAGRPSGGARAASERDGQTHQKFAEAWLKGLAPSRGGLLNGTFGRFRRG